MDAKDRGAQWPRGLLHRHPLTHVHVCGRRLEPPVLSHVVNFPRLEIPLVGCYENQIESDGRVITVRLRPGAALFAPPNCWNLPTWRHPVRLMSILFGKKQLGISLVTLKSPASQKIVAQKVSLLRPLTGPLPKLMEAVTEVQTAGGPEAIYPELARALLICVEQSFHQPEVAAANPAKSLLEDVCVYLQSHYQYDITRDSVAKQFGISPNYLSRIFQFQGHMTFSNYLMHVRTDRAKHLLRSYNLKLDDVAARCGYRDTAYFCRVFKRVAKLTPSEYRAQHRPETAADAPADAVESN